MEEKRNLILCGFMGCGKSTVGPLLAGMSGRRFVDMDSYIESQAGKSVSAIFAEEGEAHFRALEKEACKALSLEQGLVIASGGGTLIQKGNDEILRETGVIVLLDVPFDTLLERPKGDTSRPLLQKPDRGAVIQSLLAERLPIYRAVSDYVIPAQESPEAVARRILSALGETPCIALPTI